METNSEKAPQTVAEHIDVLNKCDEDVASLLRIHADAVRSLTAKGDDPGPAAEERRATFETKVDQFYETLARIHETQQKSIAALGETATREKRREGADESESKGKQGRKALLGELGSLDVSELNSRNDDIDRQIEVEQWAKAADLLQRIAAEKGMS